MIESAPVLPRFGRRVRQGFLARIAVVIVTVGCSESSGPSDGDGASGGVSSGGSVSTGGGASVGGAVHSGGQDGATGGSTTGGSAPAGGRGGESAGGMPAAGGAFSSGGIMGSGGGSDVEGSGGSSQGTGGVVQGTCTPSESVENTSGSGPYDVVIETNPDPGIGEGTIFRPAASGDGERFPILVWGQGGCSRDGLANTAAMVELASHGYFIVADGTPNGSGNRPMDKSDVASMGAPLIAYIDWALAENEKPCSAYYQSLDAQQVASNGFSCGGLMAQGTISDPRIVTWGVTSSGMAGMPDSFYDDVRTPVLFVEGGSEEVAYDGGLEGFNKISELDAPVLWFSKDLGHGGDLFRPDGGDFTRIILAWLNWWLKGDETVTGKGMLVGSECSYCQDSEWEVMSANLP